MSKEIKGSEIEMSQHQVIIATVNLTKLTVTNI
jgi:hypothetical protein